MENIFAKGQTVNTKYGVGTITYFEDDYMDVDINGRERNFFAPFSGKVWQYSPPPPKDQIWRDILDRSDMAPILSLTKLNVHGINFMTSLFKGNVTEWEELTPTQQMFHVSNATHVPLSVWKDASETNELDLIIERCNKTL